MNERGRVEVGFMVARMQSETRKHAKLDPKGNEQSGPSVRFHYFSLFERVVKIADAEFVTASLRERGNVRFKVFRDAVSEYFLNRVDRIADNSLCRTFPSRVDERREIRIRILVRQSYDGAVGRSEEYPHVFFERFFRKEHDGIAVSGIPVDRFPFHEGKISVANRVAPSSKLRIGKVYHVDGIGVFYRIRQKNPAFGEVAIPYDRADAFLDERQTFVRSFRYGARLFRHAGERRSQI